MNDLIYQYMNLGLIHYSASDSTIKEEESTIETVRNILLDDFFNAIEVSHIEDDKIRNKVKIMLEQSHMAITYGVQSTQLTTGININSADEIERLMSLEILKKELDEAYFLGAKDIVFISGNYEENMKEQSYEALVKSTKELCRYAKAKGMKVILEAFGNFGYRKSLIGTTALAKRIAEEILEQYDNFGLMVDISCMPQGYEAILEKLLPIKHYIMQVHIGNWLSKDGFAEANEHQHAKFSFLNIKRDVDQLVHFLRVLKEFKFLNTENPPIVSFEIKQFDYGDPELIIAKMKRVIREAWTRLSD